MQGSFQRADAPASVCSAIRTDPSGVTEEVGFMGDGDDRIFSCLHRPAGRPRGAVVVCSSVMSELLANYTNEVGVARMLAARGIAVRRFHYRGTGHSDGEWSDVSFERLRDDAYAVAEELASETGLPSVGFLGSRLGSLIAANVAQKYPGAPLATWEPFAQGRAFFQELFRYKRIAGVRSRGDVTNTFDAFVEQARVSPVDFAGYPIAATLFESASAIRLAAEVEPGRPVLVVGFGSRPADRVRPKEIADELTALGALVDLRFEDQRIHWLFHRPDLVSVGRVASVTAEWFETHIAQG